MQSCKHQTIIQSIYSDYVFDSWTKNYETSRNQDPKTTKLKVSSQRKQSLKIRAIMNSNNEYSTSQSQAQKKNQNIFRQLILSNLEELNDEQQNSYSKQSERSKNKSSNRFYSQHKKRQKEDFEQLTESITNNSTIFSQPLKNSKPSMLSFSQNRKLILPKINQLQSQKLLITKFKVISKVIGKFILLFYQILPNTNPLKLLYKNKLKMMMNLKKTFKFERNIDEGLSKSFTQWVEPAFQKIFYHLQNSLPKIYQENVKESKEQKDQEEIWMLNFAKFLFQNLELITRRGNVPKEIISAMSKTIYRKNNKYLQLFIAQRTQFNQYNLNFLEIQLIISEYILFNAILIPMFNLANNLKYQSFNHNINCKIKILELASIINLYYIKNFINMPIKVFDLQEEEIYSRMMYITPNQDQFIYLLDTKEKNNMNSMVLGLRNKEEYVQNILQQRPKWNLKLELLFKQFIHNLYTQVEIFD